MSSTPPSALRIPHSERTQAGSLLGTPAFMPPEQAIGAIDQIDARSDVFGLGAILCVILTGKPPYVGADAESTRQMAARVKLDDAFARLTGCGAEPDLVGLCRRCLAAERGDRPADAGAVAAAVAGLRAAAEERARQAEVDRERAAVRAAEERKRRRVVVAAAAAVAAVLTVGVGASAWQAGLTKQKTLNAANRNRLRWVTAGLVEMYEATNQPAKAREWRAKLTALPPEVAPPPRPAKR